MYYIYFSDTPRLSPISSQLHVLKTRMACVPSQRSSCDLLRGVQPDTALSMRTSLLCLGLS